MTKPNARKTAIFTLVISLLLCCVFLFCVCGEKQDVTVDFVVDGEIAVGSVFSFNVTFTGAESAVADFEKESCSFEVTSGTDVATVKDGALVVSDDAEVGEVFTVKLTVNGVSYVKEFIVAAGKPIQSVTLICPDSAEAGESVPLRAEILPAGINVLPVYTVVSGPAAVEGNLLTVSEDADGGEIVVKATAGGVTSEEKHIAIRTIQTQELYLTLARDRALPGESMPFVVTKTPTGSTFPVEFSFEKGEEIAEVSAFELTVSRDAQMGAEIVLVATSGKKQAKATLTVGHPAVEQIIAGRGGIVVPETDKKIEYTLYPETADPSTVKVSLVEGADYVEWSGGDTFRVTSSAEQNAEVVFSIESGEVFTTVSYFVGVKQVTELVISTADSVEYLRSGDSVTFTHETVPANVPQSVSYRVLSGADLVVINGNVVTVRDGADIGVVKVVAESEDGTVSNEVELTVSGRYVRRAYTSWANVAFSGYGENAAVWLVLPQVMNADGLTVIVPYEVMDLVIEGCYDGTDETAYKDLYFYFRNAPERTVTLKNFGTIATMGLGGTVFDLGSSGETEIVLKGKNLVKADSPFFLDNSGEATDGIWQTGYASASNQERVRRSGKPGYRGTAGGTAISGYSLTFSGVEGGTLTAVAGSGVNGTAGGNGADVVYDGSLSYLSGAGGDGGNGGDSGSAVYAYNVNFLSGLVNAVPGNAGYGGAGGSAGSIAAVSSYDVTKMMGTNGVRGQNGTPYPAVNAKTVKGTHYVSAIGENRSLSAVYMGNIADLSDRLSRFYGVSVYYGDKLYNPYKNKSKSNRYLMEVQTDPIVLMQQANFLMYTMSMMPKNCWNELASRNGKVNVYLCKSITSGSGSVILGLTSDTNNVWFATFNTDLRGVMYSGYFNIMLHEFTHVFHYNFARSARTNFETELKSYNFGLDYKSSYGSTERVYGVNARYDETNSCFFTAYSRKNVMEDAAETLSIAATFHGAVKPLTAGTKLRDKVECLSKAFQREYETLSPFVTGKILFADKRLAIA